MLVDATHIFDGLNAFPTHVAHMRLGAFAKVPSPWPFKDAAEAGRNTQLYNIALQWLREDREHRRELEKAGRKLRGARKDEVSSGSWNLIQQFLAQCGLQVPRDSETFYSK